MARCILFCEGDNDAIFFDEYLKRFNQTCISKPDEIHRFLNSSYILLVPCCGTLIHKIYDKLIRQLVYNKNLSVFVIIIDSNKFDKPKIIKYIKDVFIKICNNKFKPDFDLDETTCILKMYSTNRNNSVIIFKTPNTLEINIHNAYKEKYPS